MAGSAKDVIQAAMDEVGLGSLGEWAWGEYLKGTPVQDIVVLARKTDEYKARYPAMAELNKQGHGISEAQYQQYETTVQQMARSYGLPQGMYDTPAAIAKMLVNNVSATEASDRIKLAASAAYTAPPEVRQALQDAYGISPGQLIGYYLDPDAAMPLIQKQYNAAQILGMGKAQGVGVGKDQAEQLADQGITMDQARQGLGQVAQQRSLTQGEGETITTGDLIGAQFGNAASADKAARVAGTRTAAFQGGGGAASGQGGVSGLGSAGT